MRSVISGILLFFWVCLAAQPTDSVLSEGAKAPSFILRDGRAIRSVTMPYMKKIVVLNFWSTTDVLSQLYNDWLKRLLKRFRTANYTNAEGFEVISVAVQSDRESWQEAVRTDSMGMFVNGIAQRGFSEEVCAKYQVTEVPTLILIDEQGKIVSINPSMMQIENALNDRKNFRPVRKSLTGLLAQSSNKKEALKYSNVYLLSHYGDSIARTRTSENGIFSFEDLRLNHDYVLKVDNKVDLHTSDPIALYTAAGEFITDGRTRNEGFVFSLHPRVSNKLIPPDTIRGGELDEIVVIKSLKFGNNGSTLTPADLNDVNQILERLRSNNSLNLELITHTDARMEPEEALALTSRQANTLQDYFQSKGISPTRIKAIAKGNSELRKFCDGNADCRDEDHRINRRVEFLVYKD